MNVIAHLGWMHFVLVMHAAVVALSLSMRDAAAQSQVDKNPDSTKSVAQNSSKNNEPSSPSTPNQQAENERTESDIDDIIYLPGPNGKPVPVLKNATLQEFLQWMRANSKEQKKQTPKYSVTSISFDGVVEDDERAVMQAKIGVQIISDEEWVRVPLQLKEAILLDTGHGKVGEAIAGGLDREEGYRWWFRGKGVHELTLSLSVPLRKQLPSRRLQLTLPETAVSDMKLLVSMPRVSVEGPENSSVKARSIPGQSKSEIELFGLGSLLDISWLPVPEPRQVKTELQSNTLIWSELSPDSAFLEASQTIQALQGSFDKVAVRLPAGFDLLHLESEELLDYQVDSADSNRVTINFTQPTTGPIELKWTLYREFKPTDRTVTLEGFEVDLARRQTGYIAIDTLEGFRVLKRTGSDRFVHRVNVSNLRTLGELRAFVGTGQITSAYEFLKQPFRLVIALEEIEPFSTAEPHMYLKLGKEQLELELLVRFQVYRGVLRELELPWPNRKEEGWVIELPESPDKFEYIRDDSENSVSESSKDRIRLRRIETEDQTEKSSKQFLLRLKARRSLAVGENEFQVSLPRVTASSGLPALLVVANSDEIENELKPIGKTSIRPLSAQVMNTVKLPTEFDELRRTAYRIDSSERAFQCKVDVHDQEVEAHTAVTAEWEQNRFSVVQQITYNISYARLSQLRLLVPSHLQDQVLFSTDDGIALMPNWSGLEGDEFQQARLTLAQPTIGVLKIEARFVVDLAEQLSPGRVRQVSIPIIQSIESDEYSSYRFQLIDENDQDIVVSLDDSIWKPQLAIDNSTQWDAEGSQSSISLELSPSVNQSALRFSITKATVQAALNQDGNLRLRGQYRFEGIVNSLPITLPQNVSSQSINCWWDDINLSVEQFGPLSPGSSVYRLEIPDVSIGESHLLTIDYQTKGAGTLGFSDQHGFSAPQFPPNVWVDRTVWQLLLPVNQYLFTYPENLSSEFRWQRGLVFWSRVPVAEYSNLSAWLGTTGGPMKREDLDRGNSYQFSSFGPTGKIVFRSMSQQTILVLGAGLALILGVVVIRIPAARQVLTFLVLAFVIAVVGLWYLAPVLLLLQPAMIGLLAMLIGVLMQNLNSKWKRGQTVLTLSSPSDFSAPSASSVDRPAVVVGSDDPTALRPPQVAAADSHSSFDSGTET